MKDLLKKEEEAAEKAKNNHAILAKLKNMINYLYKIKSDRFLEIVEKLALEHDTMLTDETL